MVPASFGAKGIVGGAERYAHELASAMALQVPTTLVSFGEQPRVETHGALETRILGPAHYVKGQRSNPIAAGLLREIMRADVVHFHQQHVLASSTGALAARALRRKAVVSDLGGGGWDISGYISTDRLFHAHLHISEYSRRAFGQQGNPRAHVILGGVDTKKFSPGDGPPREDKRNLVALYVGRLLPHKSVHTLIDAVDGDLTVEIVGTPSHPEYFELLKQKATGKFVSFQTNSDDAALVETYRRALCVVLPSVYDTIYGIHSDVPELLGQTLLEGMACGIPAICTDVASMPEIVIDGETGFIVPPDDPRTLRERLIWLHENPDERARMGKRARARIEEHFRWEQVVDRCFRVYRSI